MKSKFGYSPDIFSTSTFREELRDAMVGAMRRELEAAAKALLEIEGELSALARDMIGQIAEREVMRVAGAMRITIEREMDRRTFNPELLVRVEFDHPIIIEKQVPLDSGAAGAYESGHRPFRALKEWK